MNINNKIAEELKLRAEQVDRAVELLDDGKTIPFIARYRKEVTGSLDDQVLRELDTRLQYLRKLEARKEEIITAIDGQGKLTEELHEKIQNAETLVEAEDLYLPYRPKERQEPHRLLQRDLNHLHVL